MVGEKGKKKGREICHQLQQAEKMSGTQSKLYLIFHTVSVPKMVKNG